MKIAEDIIRESAASFLSVAPQTTVIQAVDLMVKNKTGALLIQAGKEVLGIWSERDLLRNLLLPGFDPATVTIEDYMTSDFGFVSHSDSIYKLVDMFSESRSRYVVVKKAGSPVGLLTADDINRVGLSETTKNYRSLFEHVGCGVYISSKQGRFLDVNQVFLEMLGYDNKNEFLEIDIARDLYKTPEDRRKVQDLIERDGQIVDYELDFKRRDGSLIHVLITAQVRYDQNGNVVGYEGISIDQSQKRQIEDDYKRLFEHVGCGVYISSKEGKFLNSNQALLDMMGYERKDEFLNLDLEKDIYLNPGDRKKFMEKIERDGKVINYEVDFKHKDGRAIPILLTAHVRYGQQGEVLGYEGVSVDQTQMKKMEREQRQIEDDYKRLFEHVGCGVFISSKEGKFLNSNQALLEMMGYERKDEFLNLDLEKDLYLNPGDRKKFMEKIERDGKVINYEVDFKHKDGRAIPILLTAHVLYGQQGEVLGYEGVSVDQSQMKKMETELREAHDFLNEIIHSSPNAIIATDLEGNIIIWNRTAEKTLGYSSEEVLGEMMIDKIYSEGMAKKVLQMVRSKEYGGVGMLRAYPMVYVRRDGGVVEGNLSAALIYDSMGNEKAYVGIFVDLEERLGMERALRQTQEQLLQSEKLAAMGRLTSQIAHELNNPLYGIMNTLELIKTEIPPENRRRKILEMALSETVRLAEMLRKMLSFSKPDEEKKQSTDINTVVDEILMLHEKQLREHSIKIKTSFAEDVGNVYASKNQLRQVFLNVVSNARDAMPEGGTLTVETQQVGDKIHTRMSDTGMGIKPENMGKVFDAFFTTKDKVKGVGLGLSVCYGFIKDHGGDIKVTSEHGSGTTFDIILPVHEEAEEESAS